MNAFRVDTNLPFIASELADVVRLFYPTAALSDSGEPVVHRHVRNGRENVEWLRVGAQKREIRSEITEDALEQERRIKRSAKTALFCMLRDETGVLPPWGSLTGIRPTRLFYEALEDGMSMDEAEAHIRDTFFVSEEKSGLLREIVEAQRGLRDVPGDEFDLYIGIPFCVSRCSYCSFLSGELGNGKQVAPYIAALLREIELLRPIIDRLGLRLRAGYVGGGTPTAISAAQLRSVLDAAQTSFPGAVEWTVEAGRPDTITREKLLMLKERNVSRISVNPQTFQNETLVKIGRAHTSEDTIRAYELARELGFDDINMDIIAALPGERFLDFADTLERLISLNPDCATVHSLAIKRSSRLHERGDYSQIDDQGAEEMISFARKRLTQAGYRPYYLYRQKYMAGNLENVGYAKPGKACLYNIGNMEESARVLALGAGAITKWLFPRERRIERAANLKSIEEYVRRVDEMAERKAALLL